VTRGWLPGARPARRIGGVRPGDGAAADVCGAAMTTGGAATTDEVGCATVATLTVAATAAIASTTAATGASRGSRRIHRPRRIGCSIA